MLKVKLGISRQNYIDAILFFIAFLIPVFIVLIQSLKPELTKTFCELEAEPTDETEYMSETLKIRKKVA